MGRCNNAEAFKLIGMSKIKDTTEVNFDVHRDLPDCRKINARDYIEEMAMESVDYSYNRYLIPENRFECNRPGCVNTGTLMLSATGTAVYHFEGDSTEFANGVITFYAYVGSATSGNITVAISDTATGTNADSYTIPITATDVRDGFMPVIVDLTDTPTDIGSGWTPGNDAYIAITLPAANMGISSINIFDALSDFELDAVVKVACISSMGGSFDVSAIESTCLSSGYDKTLSSLSFPVTGNKVSANYYLLNPLNGKGEEATGFEVVTVKKTLDANAKVTLYDVAPDECGFFAVQVPSECASPELIKLNIPVEIDVDEGHYQILGGDTNTPTLKFNAILAEKDVLITYPRVMKATEITGNVENLDGVRTRMTVPLETTDGRKQIHVFNNVLVTGFPMSFTKNETEFAFTITIEKDAGGDFYHIYEEAV